MLKPILLVAGLASFALPGLAQTTEVLPSLYLGAGVTILTDRPFRSASGDLTLVGPSLTIGTALSERLALQLSAGYTWRNNTSVYSYSDGTRFGNYTNTTDSNLKVLTLPLLLRYTATPPAQRLHVDVLGGVTFLHSSSHYVYTYAQSGRVLSTDADDYTTNRANLTLGPAVRYSLTPRFEVTADALVNYILSDLSYGSFKDHLFSNVLAGVHYNFN